ncbi:MAG: Obg family GTPase CgtA, partial [Candidatus Omnitrophica bacterium]|nr:Obg family GTPase CgtA [Candidatus Omnitrophota bacterium]
MTLQGRRAPTFVDVCVLQCTAGRGGNGCSSHYRDLWMRYPRPDGGNGGNGGNVVLYVDQNIHTLLDISYRKHVQAESGKHGTSKRRRGANGKDFCVPVPPGTLIYDAQTGDLFRDLVEPGEEIIVAQGGRGGFGNAHRRESTPPEPGEERAIRMELKTVADLGIIGLPNAGKSTLLRAISAARPKVANYPFTTLTPNLGAVGLPVEGKDDPVPCVAVDVPGLIEGASSGKGLGLEFLRHIERTRALLHVVDMAGSEGRDPVKDFTVLNQELAQY